MGGSVVWVVMSMVVLGLGLADPEGKGLGRKTKMGRLVRILGGENMIVGTPRLMLGRTNRFRAFRGCDRVFRPLPRRAVVDLEGS